MESFIYLFQWLVKKAIETREEMGDFIRSYSVSQFNKHYSLPEDKSLLSSHEKVLSSIRSVKVIPSCFLNMVYSVCKS